MSIIKLLARTIILFVCSILQVIGVIAEGVLKLSVKIGENLAKLDSELKKRPVQKVKPKAKTEVVPT